MSLTAILPVSPTSFRNLDSILSSLLLRPTALRQIILVCPQSMVSLVQHASRQPLFSASHFLEFVVHPFPDSHDEYGLVTAISRVSTDWILMLGPRGLMDEGYDSWNTLLNPLSQSLPLGPRGFTLSGANSSCIPASTSPQPASYLLPPFVISLSLAVEALRPSATGNIWADLGQRVSRSFAYGPGGIVFGRTTTTDDWCSTYDPKISKLDRVGPLIENKGNATDLTSVDDLHKPGSFVILIQTLEDLHLLVSLACKLQSVGHRIAIVLHGNYDPGKDDYQLRAFKSHHCTLTYIIYPGFFLFGPIPRNTVTDHLATVIRKMLVSNPDILLYTKEDGYLEARPSDYATSLCENTVLIGIPREDWPHAAWMGSLATHEWRNWNLPRIDISVITNNRPRSLSRLLTSLSNARYFGDSINIRIHMENSADPKTMMLVNSFSWERGTVILHHRIVHGGLLPAVVESWYPHSNDVYGLLLEDDIELSPLFYGWAKMALLRYRYGHDRNHSSQLFGISLYQQRVLELRPEGRRPFNASALFTSVMLPDPSIPYLSPVPCSWGAIYFPEHWREFHAYLSARGSNLFMKNSQIIVPNVRSNRWTKSWKKYFIELAYLRGYVMLYPNYPDFVSLSTNHLEVGSHVTVRTREKQKLFVLPLMELSTTAYSSQSQPQLLDLPGGRMPSWGRLPVVNLTGELSSLHDLVLTGNKRRLELTGCANIPAAFDVHDLLCMVPENGLS